MQSFPFLSQICQPTISISMLQAYGGGGHRNASAFLLPADEFEYWKGLKTFV